MYYTHALIRYFLFAELSVEWRFEGEPPALASAIIQLPDYVAVLRKHLLETGSIPAISHVLGSRSAVDRNDHRRFYTARNVFRLDQACIEGDAIVRHKLSNLFG